MNISTGSTPIEYTSKSVFNKPTTVVLTKTDDAYVDLSVGRNGADLLVDLEGAETAANKKDLYIVDAKGNVATIDLKTPEGQKFVADLKNSIKGMGDHFKLSSVTIPTSGKVKVQIMDKVTEQINTGSLHTKSADEILKTDAGKEILKTMGLETVPMDQWTNTEKAAVAFNIGILKNRSEYADQYTKLTDSSGNKLVFNDLSFNDMAISDYVTKHPKDMQMIATMIIQNPDQSLDEKTRILDKCGLGAYKPQLTNDKKQMALTKQIEADAKDYYTQMGGDPATMPNSFLSSIGDGSGSSGVAGTKGAGSVGVGYFMYDKDSSRNEMTIPIGATEDLELKLASYGNDFAGVTGKATIKIGSQELKFDMQDNKLILTSPKTLPDGITIDSRNNIKIDHKKYNGLDVEIKLESVPNDKNLLAAEAKNDRAYIDALSRAGLTGKTVASMNADQKRELMRELGGLDEVQIQVSSSEAIQLSKPVRANDLFGNDLFEAKYENMKGDDQKDFDNMSKTIPADVVNGVKSGQPYSLNNFFDAYGGGINPVGNTAAEKRASYGVPLVDGDKSRISVKSFTSDAPTTLSIGFNSISKDKADNLKASFEKAGFPIDSKKDNNPQLSAMRTASFIKELMIQKDPSLATADWSKVTLDVSIVGDKKVTFNMADIPPY